ncbi:DOPA-like domain-containing protein [Pseudoneurospora amorphoporcata]|uniref:DOPA-like domain-containing protein n=1 Tax=Pseudoneurospora amorphoporcata TaxID=241081 RepID=A0AAN6NM07_9PEZI|nr:DOPA-like domain-containing protein [Pseudoneurospora amorphoporcata]
MPPPRTYKSPLKGYENAPPLPTEKAEDGKSLLNIQTGALSKAYDEFPEPLDNGRRGAFDIHIYHLPNHPVQAQYAAELHQRIRHEFPELRIYTFWTKPVGPHPVAMFEVNIFTPAQFGAFVGWLAVWRGPLSVLIHPNTTEKTTKEGGEIEEAEKEARNHTERAIWMGERVLLNTDLFWEAMEH